MYTTQCVTMKDYQFLTWIRDRLVFRYHESHHVDFIERLELICKEVEKLEKEAEK